VFKRPSSRRKTHQGGIVLNLVPILDAMVTLITFLLFTMSFLSLGSIESPFPTASTKQIQEKLKEKPLQLTVTLKESGAEIWSPFNKIAPKKVPHNPDGTPNAQGIHDVLIGVKKQFPKENSIVIIPASGNTYDELIVVMDSFRTMEAGDPPIFQKNEQTGNDEPLKNLFPNVIFGNLLGDA
jgi:biopolymer transport protein ExbD